MKNFAVRDLILVSLFAALTVVMSYISIPLPFSPVPLTGQTFAVMLAGLLLGAKRGALSQAIYALLGVAGLPVFSGGRAGLGHLLGPTGGFIFGFVAGAFLIGLMMEKRKRPTFAYLLLSAATGGILAVYIPGIVQLALVTGMTASRAVLVMLPYLPGDVLKVVATSLVAQGLLATGIVREARN